MKQSQKSFWYGFPLVGLVEWFGLPGVEICSLREKTPGVPAWKKFMFSQSYKKTLDLFSEGGRKKESSDFIPTTDGSTGFDSVQRKICHASTNME